MTAVLRARLRRGVTVCHPLSLISSLLLLLLIYDGAGAVAAAVAVAACGCGGCVGGVQCVVPLQRRLMPRVWQYLSYRRHFNGGLLLGLLALLFFVINLGLCDQMDRSIVRYHHAFDGGASVLI